MISCSSPPLSPHIPGHHEVAGRLYKKQDHSYNPRIFKVQRIEYVAGDEYFCGGKMKEMNEGHMQ
jgi:hypothetical protein